MLASSSMHWRTQWKALAWRWWSSWLSTNTRWDIECAMCDCMGHVRSSSRCCIESPQPCEGYTWPKPGSAPQYHVQARLVQARWGPLVNRLQHSVVCGHWACATVHWTLAALGPLWQHWAQCATRQAGRQAGHQSSSVSRGAVHTSACALLIPCSCCMPVLVCTACLDIPRTVLLCCRSMPSRTRSGMRWQH